MAVQTQWARGVISRLSAFDLALAGVLMVVPVTDTWASRPGPAAAAVLSSQWAAGCLAFRRVHPVEAFLAAAAVLVPSWAVWGAPEGLGLFLPLFIFSYALGRYEQGRRALVGLGALVVVMAAHEALDPAIRSLDAVRGAALWDVLGILAWVAGALVRSWRTGAAERRDRRLLEERSRLARELHDLIAHGISVMVLQAEAAAEMIERGRPQEALHAVERVQRTGRDGLREVRRLVGVLRNGEELSHAPQPGVGALDELVRSAEGVGPAITLTERGTRGSLGDGISLALYRIVQEALTNALRHANASHIDIDIDYADPLQVSVTDDGAASGQGGADGFGLRGMRERAELYGGRLFTGPGEAGGFVVRAVIPRGSRP